MQIFSNYSKDAGWGGKTYPQPVPCLPESSLKKIDFEDFIDINLPRLILLLHIF